MWWSSEPMRSQHCLLQLDAASHAVLSEGSPVPSLCSAAMGAQSESAQSKMLSGIGGFVLGLLFLGVGLFIHCRNQKGHSGLQPTGLLS
ncbi:HLA class II histocompatibility antigen, DR beta 4 chain-like [Pteropus medius]|uniref:HLA class II histocompatibility antigen, DR beta 4 chain-like n=1 Tax=Pteropus vampyrus TaxID=132908 RepID=UPI00196A7F85|nr:HLA class II histocompatibility antigen, DR beta 4 chain-like [Pteropus giganteus]